ncbi:VanZ family protein [Paenibacillus senegalensis]|uniref:VanZ family protein n=1 Tax=Paenibacillus senegalensis TaxID=1465766 RepID=UPI0005A9B92C|nr:VanZ family protein [Paenibacillus senegalensis]
MLIRWLPSLACMAAIFYFSSRTGEALGSILPWFQKWLPGMESFDWGHFVAYFVLCSTFVWALGDGVPSWGVKLAAVGLSVAYGITDEFHQLFVDGRQADWKDVRNDGIGALIAVLFLSIKPVGQLYRKLPHAKKY